MPSTWDPRELLDCNPLGCSTCVGTTLKGKRCLNIVNIGDCLEASRLFDRMALKDPRDVQLSELERLAELTLCLRWHRYHPGHGQIQTVSRDWLITIREEYPRRRVREPSPQPRSRRAAVETVVVETASSAPLSRSITTRRPVVALITPPPSPPPTRLRLSAPSPTSSRSPSESRTPSPGPAPIVESADQIQQQSPPPTPLLRSIEDPQPPSSPMVENLPSPPRTPSPTPQTGQSSPAEPEQPSIPQPTEPEHHHLRRRPLTDPCPICISDICCEDDAVWCRAQCGQNVHRGCFAAWRRECLENTDRDQQARVSCVYCRATWKWEWEE